LYILQLASTFLALAIACAASIQQLNHDGLQQHASTNAGFYISWPKVCDNYKTFCGMIDAAMAMTALAFIAVAASTGLDVYILRMILPAR
jgi:hypothetical protein